MRHTASRRRTCAGVDRPQTLAQGERAGTAARRDNWVGGVDEREARRALRRGGSFFGGHHDDGTTPDDGSDLNDDLSRMCHTDGESALTWAVLGPAIVFAVLWAAAVWA